MKKILSLLLVALMIVGMLPLNAINAKAAAAAGDSVTYTFSSYTAGAQYAKNEEHVLDGDVTVVTNDCHFTTQLRIYSSSTNNGYAVIKCTNNGLTFSGLKLSAGNKVDTLNVYGSNDEGASWTLIQGVSVTSTSYKDYTVNFSANYKWLKLDVAGSNQVRVQNMTLTFAEDSAAEEEQFFNVVFSVPESVESIDTQSVGNQTGIELPEAEVPAGQYPYTFVGWVEAEVNNSNTKPATVHPAGETFKPIADTTLYALYSYADTSDATVGYVKKDITDLKTEDVFVIVSDKSGATYAMSNDKGTGSAPAAVSVTVTNNKLESNPADNLKWKISFDSTSGSYTFYPSGDTTKWLYCTSTNNGVRVGTNAAKLFTMDSSGYLKHTGTNRYLGVYNNADWRCYTNTTGNTAGQTFAFYAYSLVGTTYYTTVVAATECEHTNTTVTTVEATCTTEGSITESCDDCDFIIHQQTIAKADHSYESVVTNPTCTAKGYTTHTCAVCGDTKVDTETDTVPHNYVDGFCSVCNAEKPASLAGRYYIATIRSSGNYFYMTSDLGTASTKRYQAVDSGSTTLPETITASENDNKVFVLVENTNGTYSIYVDGVEGEEIYLGWTSDNSGILVAQADALQLTVEKLEKGLINIHFTGDVERYLALNNNSGSNYFAWYKSGQKQDLSLIPVVEGGSETPDPSEPTDPSEPETPVDPPVTETPDTPTEAPTGYVKVTEAPEDWTGTYLIVYEGEDGKAYIFNSTDEANGYLSGTISDNVIACSTEVDAEAVIIEQMNGGYAIKTKNGYIYGTSGSNKLNFNTSTQQLNTIELAEDGVLITSNTSVLVFNDTADQMRFRYYKSASYASYQAVALYKLSSAGTPDTPDTPDCEHTNTTEVSVPATCYTAGSVTITCDNCNEVVGTETIPAGHTFVEGVCSGCNLVEAPVAGTAYKFGMVQGKLNNKIYYINGAMDGYYMGTVEVDANGVSVYLEQTEGGYYFYTYVDGAKKYINMVVDGTYVNGAYEDTASTVYTYNAEKYTIVADVSGTAYWFGTRNDNTYTTMGPVKVSYNGFYGQFYAVSNKVTAAQGATQLQAEVESLYNGIELPATVMVGETVMNVTWSVESTDANAAQIVDGKLVIAPQAAAATYTLTATVQNGESDTATATWTGSVVPTSAALENGTYVFWINDLAITNVYADTTKDYGDLTSTAGIALTDGKLTGYTNANIFTLTANGDGTYTIQANGGNYLYSDMSHASSRYFNLAAEKPASGADWTIVASGEGYYIYNVDRAGAIGLYASNNTFSLYTDAAKHSVLNVTAVDPCVHTNTTTTTVDPTCIYTGSTTVTCTDCGMTLSVTEIPANGHSYDAEGICSVCQGKDPYVYGIKYYIATVRSEGNYMYMTSDLGTASTLRYQQLDSGLTVAPVNIEPDAAQAGCVFILMPNDDGTYYILADGVEGDNYLGWTSDNSGILVSEAEALKVTLTEQADGTYIISFGEGDSGRNLALNSNAKYKYFAWYTSAQCNKLSLIPVRETVNEINAWGLTLGSDLSVRFNVSLTEGTKFVINVAGQTYTYTADELSAVENGTYDAYVSLAAVQMADAINVQFVNGDVKSEVKTYTVAQYAAAILAGEYDDATKTLVQAMLNYGAAAQNYFEYNDGNPVSNQTGANDVPETADTEKPVDGSAEGIRFYGASLVYREKIAVRFYFTGSVENATFVVNEKEVTPVKKDGMYYIEVADILPQDLNKPVTVTVGEMTVSYSPMNYIVRMNAKGGDSVKAMVRELYNYYVAAVAYLKTK